jgi:uncharacterized damage-inducible protein DinB
MSAVTPEGLLEHWQGHRRLTRRVIEAFPEDQLNTFAVGGMRPFGLLVLELLVMGAPMARGVATGEWDSSFDRDPLEKAELLRQWDEGTEQIKTYWSQFRPGVFDETLTAFGQYTDRTSTLLLYVIDNEIHHRAQGYVYLRALGIDPPPFWERQ